MPVLLIYHHIWHSCNRYAWSTCMIYLQHKGHSNICNVYSSVVMLYLTFLHIVVPSLIVFTLLANSCLRRHQEMHSYYLRVFTVGYKQGASLCLFYWAIITFNIHTIVTDLLAISGIIVLIVPMVVQYLTFFNHIVPSLLTISEGFCIYLTGQQLFVSASLCYLQSLIEWSISDIHPGECQWDWVSVFLSHMLIPVLHVLSSEASAMVSSLVVCSMFNRSGFCRKFSFTPGKHRSYACSFHLLWFDPLIW